MFAIHQKKDPDEEPDQNAWRQYCLDASVDLIYKSKSLYFMINGEDEPTAVVQQEEAKVQEEVLV